MRAFLKTINNILSLHQTIISSVATRSKPDDGQFYSSLEDKQKVFQNNKYLANRLARWYQDGAYF